MNRRVSVELPNRIEYLDVVYSITDAVLDRLPFGPEKKYLVSVAVSEGFTNAWLHGNQQMPDKKIILRYRAEPEYLRLEIEDEGVLPIKKTMDSLPPLRESEAISGRGLAIIKETVDKVTVRHEQGRGNILTIVSYFEKDAERIANKDTREVGDGHLNQNT